MAHRNGLLPCLLERELLGGRRSYIPNSYSHAFTCQAKHAGIIRIDPDGGPCPPYSITYNQVANGCRFLTVGDEEGCVSIVDTSAEMLPMSLYTDHERAPRAKWLAHNNTIFDMAWAKNDSVLYTASGDQHVGVWDTAAGCLRVYCSGHDGSVKAVCPHSSQPDMFASGSRDGGILLWDLRTPSKWSAARRRMQLGPVMRIDIATAAGQTHGSTGNGTGAYGGTGSTPGSGKKRGRGSSGRAAGGSSNCRRSVTSLLFVRDEHTMISSSDMDGVVKLWDLRKLTTPTAGITLPAGAAAAAAAAGGNTGRRGTAAGRGRVSGGQSSKRGGDDAGVCWLGFTCPSPSGKPAGITNMALSPTGDMLLVSSIDSCHYLYSLSALDQPPVAVLTGHRTDSFCVKSCFSPCGRHVLSGSSDKRAYIWDLSQPTAPPATLPGHAGEVTAVAWCPSDHCQLATAADDATLRVWAMDRSNSRYMQDFKQYNYHFTDEQQTKQNYGLWERFGFSSSNSGNNKAAAAAAVQAEGSCEPAAAADGAKLPGNTGPAAAAATSTGRAGVGSTCSPPVTPQLPFWRSSSTAAAAAAAACGGSGAAEGTSAPPGTVSAKDAAAAAGGGAMTPAALDACQTPAVRRCMGPPGSAAAANPLLPPQPTVAARQQRHTTPRLRQLSLPEQLSAARLAAQQQRQKAQAAAVADGSIAAAAAAAAAAAPQGQGPSGTELKPAAAAEAGAQNSSAEAAAAAAGADTSPERGARQLFERWMNGLTPSPESPGGQPAAAAAGVAAGNDLAEPKPAAAAADAGPGPGSAAYDHQQLQQACVGCVCSHGPPPRSTCRRGGVVELSTPWALPTPVRQQRQQEVAAMEADRLQQSQLKMRNLSLQQHCPGDDLQQRQQQQQQCGAGAAASELLPPVPAAAGCRGGDSGAAGGLFCSMHGVGNGAGSSCCRLLQDEFEVYCDEQGSAGAAAAAAPCSSAPGDPTSTPRGLSCQENIWQQQQQLSKDTAETSGEAIGAALDALGEGDMYESGALCDDVDMVPCSLPVDGIPDVVLATPDEPASQQQLQQAFIHFPRQQQLQQQQQQQQQHTPIATPAGGAAALHAVPGQKPGEVLLGAAGVSRKPLGDLSDLLPVAGSEALSPGNTHVPAGVAAAAAALAGRPGCGAVNGSINRAKELELSVAHRNSPVRALNMSTAPPGSPAAGSGATAADSPLLQMLLHGRQQQQQQHGVGALLRSPDRQQCLSPGRHSPGHAAAGGGGSGGGGEPNRRLSRLGERHVSPLTFAPHTNQQQQQHLGTWGAAAAAGGGPPERAGHAPVGVLHMMHHHGQTPGAQQPGRLMLEQQQQQQQQQLLHSNVGGAAAGVPYAAGTQEEGQGEAGACDEAVPPGSGAAAAAAAGASPSQPAGRSGGIKRSYAGGSSSKKRQQTLSSLWNKPPEVEDGASRFSGW